MLVFVPRETAGGEKRAALTPAGAGKLAKAGLDIAVESGLGSCCRHQNSDFELEGVSVVADRAAMLSEADLVLRVRKPPADEVSLLRKGCIHVSFLDPFNEPELIDALAARGVTAISMEMIPRTAFAQKMDALSSQANLVGYAATVLAAERLDKIFPMMMTAAGTLAPARVFIVGVGVAGLQAIATAKRLGARVDAFDTRPVVAEQVRSLGARFVEIDVGETGQTEQGYAKPLTEEQLDKQREGMARICAQSDVVITTAQVFGKRAPIIITRDMVAGMRSGSVIVDCAVESGGNVEGAVPGEEIELNGVRVVGLKNMPSMVCGDATIMYSNNITSLVELMWDKKSGSIVLDHDVLKACIITRDGELVNSQVLRARGLLAEVPK